MSLLVILDKMLRDAGLDFDTAKALLAPGQDDLVIHVHQLLDGAPQPTAGAITSRVVVNPELMAPPANPHDVSTSRGLVVVDAGGAGGHGGGTLRHTPPGGPAYSRAAPTILTTSDEPVTEHRPPRLPEDGRGVTYAQLIAAAESVRMTVRQGLGTVLILTSATGSTAFPDWPSAIRVIRARQDFADLGYARGVIGG